MDKDFMLNYYDKMVRPIWTELMKTPRYQRAACERDKIEREFRRLLDEKLGRKYLELDDALFRVMDDIAEAMLIWHTMVTRKMICAIFQHVQKNTAPKKSTSLKRTNPTLAILFI